MKPLLLAFLFLITPAQAGKTDLAKAPACAAGVMVVQPEPETVFHPVYIKPKKLYGLLNIFYAREILKPCKTLGLVRSVKDAKCYQKSRLP